MATTKKAAPKKAATKKAATKKAASKKSDPCWEGYEKVGNKNKAGKSVPNCVPEKQIRLKLDNAEIVKHRPDEQLQPPAVIKF